MSSWSLEAECARCSLVLPSSEILDLLPSARTFPTIARGLSACRESIAVYIKLGERGRVTFNHRERNVSGAMGFQNKTPIRCQNWINVNGLKRNRTTFKKQLRLRPFDDACTPNSSQHLQFVPFKHNDVCSSTLKIEDFLRIQTLICHT